MERPYSLGMRDVINDAFNAIRRINAFFSTSPHTVLDRMRIIGFVRHSMKSERIQRKTGTPPGRRLPPSVCIHEHDGKFHLVPEIPGRTVENPVSGSILHDQGRRRKPISNRVIRL